MILENVENRHVVPRSCAVGLIHSNISAEYPAQAEPCSYMYAADLRASEVPDRIFKLQPKFRLIAAQASSLPCSAFLNTVGRSYAGRWDLEEGKRGGR